jgi:hypothetical protein
MRKFLFLFFLFLYFTGFPQSVKPLQLVAQMLDSVKAIQTVRFKVTAFERIEDKYVKVVSEDKLQIKPRKLYLINREKKLEILYVEGQHDNKALVKPNTFPFITIPLSPTGALMRKNQHYTIHDIGFESIGRVMALALSKEKDNINKGLRYIGKQEKNGYSCYLLVYESKNFSYTEYIVKQKETISSIAAKLEVNDYILRAKNKFYNDYDYVKTGTKLQVPVYYCKKAVLYLDEKSFLPVSVSVFDDVGLLENYDFTNIILNKPFDPKEFTREYKEYHF